MRPVSWLAYGTSHYPERIARRLRALNVAAWIGGVIWLATAVNLAATDWTNYKWLAGINALCGTLCAALPFLHRFGAVAAPTGLAFVVFASNVALAVLIGRDSGIHLWLLPTASLGVVFFGLERRGYVAVTLATALALVLAVQAFVPPVAAGIRVDPALIETFHLTALAGGFVIVVLAVVYAVRQTDRAEAALEREYARSEGLLANILPAPVAARLKAGETVIADRVPQATVLFADLSGFTDWSAQASPEALIGYLNRIFSEFDALTEKHGLEKIKTIGDAYMAVAGVLEPDPDHAARAARLALDMMRVMNEPQPAAGPSLKLRIGIATGPVVAGVIGTRKFAYDVWGDTVNLASRMESHGVPGRIQVAPSTHGLLQHEFEFEARQAINVRSIGALAPWLLVGRKAGALSG